MKKTHFSESIEKNEGHEEYLEHLEKGGPEFRVLVESELRVLVPELTDEEISNEIDSIAKQNLSGAEINNYINALVIEQIVKKFDEHTKALDEGNVPDAEHAGKAGVERLQRLLASADQLKSGVVNRYQGQYTEFNSQSVQYFDSPQDAENYLTAHPPRHGGSNWSEESRIVNGNELVVAYSNNPNLLEYNYYIGGALIAKKGLEYVGDHTDTNRRFAYYIYTDDNQSIRVAEEIFDLYIKNAEMLTGSQDD